MNYMGGIYREAIGLVRAVEVYAFLKLALQQVPADKPFRGPERFNYGNFGYTNETKGVLSAFQGIERIKWKGEVSEKLLGSHPLYVLIYHGGLMSEENGLVTP